MSSSRSLALVAILALSLILLWFVFEQTADVNPLRDSLTQILSPVQLVVHRASRPLLEFVDHVGELSRIAQENQALRAENAELRSQIILLQEAQIENETLRRQLSFQSAVPNYKLLSAEVIGHDPNNLLQYLVIDRGAADGIEQSMPVLAAEGLVGRISEVSARSSKVMLLTDGSSSVSALVQRSRATGIVQGESAQSLAMLYIPTGDTIAPGDTILTSGLGGNFPKRLVIGTVSSVARGDVRMFNEATLVPAVNMRSLETVMVLLNFAPLESSPESTTPDASP